jgi:hypothetical protein
MSLTAQEFILKAQKVHGNRYIYSSTEYKNTRTNIKIICREHGEFEQTAGNHLNGCGCSKCFGTFTKTNKEFIQEAQKIHGDKYDYSKINYINNYTKIEVICKEHGSFNIRPQRHLQGQGCPICSGTRCNTQEFIKKAQKIHGDKYDYSLVNYNKNEKIKIICKEHGVFEQIPSIHLHNYGCPKCSGNSYTIKEFIEKANKVHNNKYDYSLTEYKNNRTKITIICPEHGKFEQIPSNHLNGTGCSICNDNNNIKNFKEKANKIHNNKYDYSLVNSIKSRKIKIICPEHGIFEQDIQNHLGGHGCPKCFGNAKLTLDEFKEKANKIHNNKYDYSLIDSIKNNSTKVKIVCPEHGIFEQKPNSHLNGSGCPICGGKEPVTLEKFIERSNKIHNNKYDYSLVDYKSIRTKIKIICPEHGVFIQSPLIHLNGCGCSKCSGKYSYTTQEFIEKANKIHNNKYDYSLVNYINSSTRINIICPEHGEFEQLPHSHLKGANCSKCAGIYSYDTAEFIKKANKVHNNKYDYSLTNYVNQNTKLKIICPKHGEFIQNSNSHLNGSGCPHCKESKGETLIRNYLLEHNIKFNPQYKFKDCKDERVLPFDFYLSEHNICIEYQGIQHYKPVKYWGDEVAFDKNKKHDKIKYNYCKQNKIKLIRIKYNKNIIEILDKNLVKI